MRKGRCEGRQEREGSGEARVSSGCGHARLPCNYCPWLPHACRGPRLPNPHFFHPLLGLPCLLADDAKGQEAHPREAARQPKAPRQPAGNHVCRLGLPPPPPRLARLLGGAHRVAHRAAGGAGSLAWLWRCRRLGGRCRAAVWLGCLRLAHQHASCKAGGGSSALAHGNGKSARLRPAAGAAARRKHRMAEHAPLLARAGLQDAAAAAAGWKGRGRRSPAGSASAGTTAASTDMLHSRRSVNAAACGG